MQFGLLFVWNLSFLYSFVALLRSLGLGCHLVSHFLAAPTISFELIISVSAFLSRLFGHALLFLWLAHPSFIFIIFFFVRYCPFPAFIFIVFPDSPVFSFLIIISSPDFISASFQFLPVFPIFTSFPFPSFLPFLSTVFTSPAAVLVCLQPSAFALIVAYPVVLVLLPVPFLLLQLKE